MNGSAATHFHIRWSSASTLDWEAFPTLEAAQLQAEQLVRVGETYTIEQADGECPRCNSRSWQSSVPNESRSAKRPGEVSDDYNPSQRHQR